jgi:hypothetical protein
MRKIILGVLLAGLPAVGVHAVDQHRRASIGDYGVFEAMGDLDRVRLKASPSGAKLETDGVRYIDRTRWVPTRKGIRFGFNYEITNVTEGPVEVMVLVSHPPIEKPDGTVSKGFKFKEKVPLLEGKARGFTGYSFDHDYELVTGEWKFELWVREGKLLEWTFIATKDTGAWKPLPWYERPPQ